MNNIKIHRGLEQIGGCITEIWTDSSRVFIDFGQNLPAIGEQSTPEQDRDMVGAILSQNVKEHQAVFYTHAHEDHVGLFRYIPNDIPQYIGEGAKEILIARYKQMLWEEEDEELMDKIQSFKTWERSKPYSTPESITIGDIRITPFYSCHSIYDSYMFLIEAGGKRIWHTGDYRTHSYLGKGLNATLRDYATNIDTLITEGTLLNTKEDCISEKEVSRKMGNVMQAFKYVVVLASSTDMERLASIKVAAKLSRKELYVCNSYMRRMMRLFTMREARTSKGLFSFHPRYISWESDRKPLKQRNGFVLIAGVGNLSFVQDLCSELNPKEVLLIFSSWEGYYKNPEQVDINPGYKLFRDSFTNVVDIHTSGHADRNTIKRVIGMINPEEVICIHKEPGASL